MHKIIVYLLILTSILIAFERHPILRKDLRCITDNDGNAELPVDYVYNAKYVIMFFSASWCPSCKEFTPELVKFYNAHQNDSIVVLYVPSDSDKKSMMKYLKKANMPWNAVMFGTSCVENMKNRFHKGSTIPYIAVLDIKDKMIIKGNQETLEQMTAYFDSLGVESPAIDMYRKKLKDAGVPDSLIDAFQKSVQKSDN